MIATLLGVEKKIALGIADNTWVYYVKSVNK